MYYVVVNTYSQKCRQIKIEIFFIQKTLLKDYCKLQDQEFYCHLLSSVHFRILITYLFTFQVMELI